MFAMFRAITYGVLVVGVALLLVPARALSSVGISRPPAFGGPQIAGTLLAGAAAVLYLWCVVAFAFVGKGTPAVFDPPRRLVIRGPYRYVRNPMYVCVGFVFAGAALVYESLALLAFVGLFFVVIHLFVTLYEEPTLGRSFGDEYEAYRRQVARWWPHW